MNTPRVFGLALLLVGAVAAAEPVAPKSAERPRYLDPDAPMEARIQDLVKRMTVEEKGSMMSNTTPGVPRLGIPKYNWWNEALHGVARAGEATVFPQAIGLAAMWDETLHHDIAAAIGVEARAKFNAAAGTPHEGEIYYGLTFWSPNINIFRDPRWGRGQETYGEDPFLTGRLGTAFVRGLQGDDPRYLLAAACAKHFAVHSGPEPLRHGFDVSPSSEDLYETYLPAFEALVREGRVEVVMTAYNSLYGQPCSINPLLYYQLAKWGFNGHVTSDCGSIDDLVDSYKRAPDLAGAEALALKAGLNVRCGWTPDAVADAVKRGLLSEAELDYRVSALLRTMFRLGFFDPKDRVPFSKIAPTENHSPAHAALALRAARESLVLLKNDGTLPLNKSALRRVAVIGPNADSHAVLLGNYNGKPIALVSVLEGLQAALGAGVSVDFVRGCENVAADGLTAVPGSCLDAGGEAGVKTETFAGSDFTGAPTGSWTIETPAIDWTSNARAQVPFVARWTGTLSPHFAGGYELSLGAHGGYRLYLGDELVIDGWSNKGDGEKTIRRSFAAGEKVALRIEYRHDDGPAQMALKWKTPPPDEGFAAAVDAAKAADAVVFVGGITASLEGEEMPVELAGFKGGDRTAIELPEVQRQLLERLVATGRPVMFVNMSGSAIAMPEIDAQVNAIIQAWYGGQAAGTAVADVLFGDYNPAGRLPVTFYRATTDLPPFENYDMTGRTYRYFKGKPLYAFGHGLSYTKFNYANLSVAPASGLNRVLADTKTTLLSSNPTSLVRVDVTNAGDRDGDEVVQVYARPPAARENEALCGFTRVHLAKGETRTVEVFVPASALRRWSAEKNDYVIPSGEWSFRVGAASDDIRQTVAVKL
ncbi:MAG TPA: glycoside hydrolase family 3 C-terminal domain-containing protein [Lacunisphaera sp.]|nr:glycoside hydrolase family 3 C-terminal domain-containing protein [Lacunisphaera sp.]